MESLVKPGGIASKTRKLLFVEGLIIERIIGFHYQRNSLVICLSETKVANIRCYGRAVREFQELI
jgi:hypothetical protein